MNKLCLLFFVLFVSAMTVALATEPEPVEPLFPTPESLKITQFIYTLTVVQSATDGMRLWELFFTALKASPECGNFPRFISSPYNLYNTQHRLYIDQLNDACTDAVMQKLIEDANAAFLLPPPEPVEPVEGEQKPPTDEFNTLANEPVAVTPAFVSFKREPVFDMDPELCFDGMTNQLQCLEHSTKCNIKCPVGTICSKDIVCGSSDCLADPTYINDKGEKYRVCTSDAGAAAVMIAIVAAVVAVMF